MNPSGLSHLEINGYRCFFSVSPSTHLVSVSQKVSAFCFLLFNSFLVLDSCLPSHMISRSQSPSATQAILPPEVFSFSHAMRCVITSRKVGASSTSAWVFCCGKIKTSLPRQGGLAPTSYQACAQNVELIYTHVRMYTYIYICYILVYRQSINLYKYTLHHRFSMLVHIPTFAYLVTRHFTRHFSQLVSCHPKSLSFLPD